MDRVELVLAVEADEPEMLALAQAFHAENGHPLTEQGAAALRATMRGHPLAKAWLVREAGRTVGYAVLGFGYGIEYGGADAFVDDLYLVPDARHRGIGAVVLGQLEAEARAMRLNALFLVVDPDNAPALRLYRRQGFTGTRWLLMAKQLRPPST
jgi:ribosomal protein S18 acetylase RimI-like enzyme